jgi:secreted PhoX family phosphatase
MAGTADANNKQGENQMRDIDRRTTVSRRVFLRTTAAAPAAASLAVGIGISADAAWAADAKNLTPHVMATLVKVARDLFPHDNLADKFYITACAGYDALAADAGKKKLLTDGVAELDKAATAKFKEANYLAVNWEADRVSLLHGIEHTPFFAKLRGDLVVTLYNQKDLWPKFGYEGSSADKGGYINRGFSDIDWLPTA